MASVLYDLRMICWLFVWWKSEAVRSGVVVVKNPGLGVILAGREELFVLPSPGQNMVAVQRKHVATKKKAPDVEIGCLVLFVTQSFPRRDFLKAASA